MSKPICDFVEEYSKKNPVRLHMPGHKGKDIIGIENMDITEISGADELFSPEGIIRQSEKIASDLFGAYTIYSAGGSTLCIQAMLRTICLYAAANKKKPCILAGRNAHKAFINGAALLDIDVKWIYSAGEYYHACKFSAEELEMKIKETKPDAVYITSPDYLGNISDIEKIAKICRKNGVLLAVDNAHGSYLKFSNRHPIDLGAHICCDSAHKTLPVLTGGAYLHISDDAPEILRENAKKSMALFGSSSPSYLILQSLDAVNDEFLRLKEQTTEIIKKVDKLKKSLKELGFELAGGEPLKITVKPKKFGYTGVEIAEILEENNVYPEFFDNDFTVLMFSACSDDEDIKKTERIFSQIPKKTEIKVIPPLMARPEKALSPRFAILSQSEELPIEQCEGRICAETSVSCPPAIPIVVCGEKIDREVIENFKYYNVKSCTVLKEN